MIFPIGDDQVKGGYFPLFSYTFIVINVVVFYFEIQLQGEGKLGAFINEYGAIPGEITRGEDVFTLFTSMFLHGGYMHLIGNMMFLWVFADNIEAVVSNAIFLVFYILGGLIAAGTHIYFDIDSYIPMVGASGAISAVMGAYLVMFPRSRIKVWVFLIIVQVPAIAFLGLWIFQQWSAGMAALDALEEEMSNVAYWAHIGGFVFGVLAGFYFRSAGYMKDVVLKK